MMMFAGAALTALDFLSGLATSAAKSMAQQSSAATSNSAASSFALANTSSIAANDTARSASSALSADTLQTLLALQQDFKQTSSADLLSLLDGDKDGNSGKRNAVLEETQRRLQQTQALALTAPGQVVTMSV